MADEYNDDDQNEQQDQSPDIRALRQKAKERDTLAAQLAERERELAFAKSGLDFNDPKLKYFIKGYEGDLTPEAIKAKAQEDGFLAAQASSTDQAEVNAHQRLTNASSGANETPTPDLADLISQANSPEEVMALVSKNNLPTAWNRPE
jgi:putative heme degradation protein